MLGTFTLALTIIAVDPRPELVELQLAGKHREALARVERELAERPEESKRLGLSFLHGHLLDRLGRLMDAGKSFGRSMNETPVLEPYGRFRLAQDQSRLQHPELAAGLLADVVAQEPASPLTPKAVRLLGHSLAAGGDCQFLRRLRPERMPFAQRREIQLVQGDCALRAGYREMARSFLVSLLEESRGDDLAHGAADRLSGMVSEAERGRVPMLLGLTFYQHREFDRALQHLQRALGDGNGLPARDDHETRLAIGLSLISQQRYREAVAVLNRLALLSRSSGERARALYEEATAWEMLGARQNASNRFRQTYVTEPRGRLAAAALFGALRQEWRTGSERTALELYRQLAGRPEWRDEAVRAALFLAASDLVRGRSDRARPWLDQAFQGGREDRLEANYWRGRFDELTRSAPSAIDRYLDVVRADPYHPLARAALTRLTTGSLARTAAATGRSLAGSANPESLHGAWLLLGDGYLAGKTARRRLSQIFLADPATAPYLRLTEVPVRSWPMWSKTLSRPEEMLLALGIWYEGAPAVRQHFPLSSPALAYTGGALFARGYETAQSIAVAETLRSRAPARLPLALQPAEYRRLLYPFLYRKTIVAQGALRQVPPELLAAVIREESRFDSGELTPATGGFGLAQLTLSTARHLAAQLKLPQRLNPQDLYNPNVSIALGAAHLGVLLKDFGGSRMGAVAAYEAGEPQALVWRSYCFTGEPEEYFTKIGSREVRDYVRRVLAGQEHYEELY
jgi:soluble lytic murein transglycosylase-like protein